MMSDISMKDMDVAIKDLTVDLDGEFLNGTADAKEIKSGGLAAKEVSGKLSLNNYSKINLTDLSGTAFDGKVTGKLSYDINTAKINLESALLLAKKYNMNDLISKIYYIYANYYFELGSVQSQKQLEYLRGASSMYEKALKIIVKTTKNTVLKDKIAVRKENLMDYCNKNSLPL